MRTSLQLSLLAVFALGLSSSALSQKIGAGKSDTASAYKLRTAAVLPIGFFNDDEALKLDVHKESQDMFRDVLKSLLEHYGINRVDQATTNSAYSQMAGQPFDTEHYGDMPKPEDMVRLGKHLGVDLVIVPRCRYHVKSIVTITGLKTKASAKVDLWIIDVRKSEFDLHANAVILVAPVVAFVSGGAEAPHMQKAGVAGLIKAIKPWTEKQETSKIGSGNR